MNPFMLQHSKVVHDERLAEAAYERHLNEAGNALPKRTLPSLADVFSNLGQKMSTKSQSRPAPSTSHIS